MNQEVARTLGELERKLGELERTLNAISAGEESRGAHDTTAATPIPVESPAEPPQADLERLHGSGWSRIVDESIENVQPAVGALSDAPAETRRIDDASPAARQLRDATPAGGEIGDGVTAADAPSPTPASLEPALAATPAPSPSRLVPHTAPTPEATRPGAPQPARTPQPPRRPTSPGPVQPPSATELLRFRDRLERAARDLTDDYDELLGRLSYSAVATTTQPTISFARGAPSLDIVDVDGLRDAARRAFESDPAGTTAYGTSVGYPRLRSWIADRHGVDPERVLVTNGSMQADAFLFEQLVRSGDEVIVERPTYDRTLLSLRQRGARVHAVELEPDGIDTEALSRLLSGGFAAQPTLAHIIPNFQNPAGYTLSFEKRRRLLELAADHGFMIFEDDPYVELRFSGETLPTMLSMDPERVVYASSFSKTVCPGIRVGYLVGPTDLIAAVAQLATNTYISPNMVAQSIVYEFCASGAIDRSIETVKAALAERVETLAGALRRDLPEADFVVPQGGYFMWVTLPEGTDVAALFRAAAERGVAFVKGTDFLLDGGENTLRLAYSGVTPEQIDTGVARLAEAYRSL